MEQTVVEVLVVTRNRHIKALVGEMGAGQGWAAECLTSKRAFARLELPGEYVLVSEQPRTLAKAFEDHPAVPRLGIGAGVQNTYGDLPDDADADQFGAFMERVVNLMRVLDNPVAKQLVASISSLPAVPATYNALQAASADPNVKITDLAPIIAKDPALSAKVLQLVNSAFFGLRQRVTSVSRAVQLLGINMVKGLALASQVFVAMHGETGFDIDQFQAFAIRVARLSQSFLDEKELAEEAFTAAVVMDIGQLVLATRRRDVYAEVLQRVNLEGEPLVQTERNLLGVSHATVGAVLLAQWGIPGRIVEIVAFHHEPACVRGAGTEVLAAVHAADRLLGIETCGEDEESLDVAFLHRAGFEDALPSWRQIAASVADPEPA